ncbi:MAG: serine/threonine protein kinase [Prevotella sp.]|nr:serine/threonine protein kinase [Prevotella sp.]MBR5653799.1 serine/threonine protein kinase [Prevotella sp.]
MTKPSIISPHEEEPREEERFVASGGTCACYLLRKHGRLLLKKQLLPAFAHDERHRQALEKEFEVGFPLDHPNIPRYLECHDDWLLMEYVDGVTLTEFLRQHPGYFRKRQHARQFADELLSAVAYLHQHQVLHLDLKPDNILITRIGSHVKLIDLGYCYQDSYPFTTGGTADYSAPDEEKTPASDIYSLGRIFSDLGIGNKTVVNRCLSADAAERYQSVDKLAKAMRKSRSPWLATTALLFLLLLGGLSWWVLEDYSTADNTAICTNDGFTNLADISPSDWNTERSRFRTIRLDLSSAHTNTIGHYVSVVLHNLTTGATDWFRNRIQTLPKSMGLQIRDDSYVDRSITDIGILVPESDNLYEYMFSAEMEVYTIDDNVDKSMVWLKLSAPQAGDRDMQGAP